MSAPAVVQESALDRALALAGGGFYTFPSRAKDRHIPGWPQRATRDPEQIKAWFSGPYKDCWPSIYTGRYGDNQSLIVVDVDPKGLTAVDALDDILPDTRVHSTPRGGLHGFYAVPYPGVKSGTHVLAEGIDIRSKGGLVHFGAEYSIKQAEAIADAPAELLAKCGDLAADTAPADRAQDRIAPDQEVALQRAEELMRAAPRATDGGRNEALCQFVYRVRENCATDADSTLAIGLAFAAEHCDPPYPEDQARATIRSAIRSAQNPAGSKTALPEDFPVVVQDEANAAIEKAGRPDDAMRLRRVRSLAALQPGPALWEGVLPDRAVFAIGALPGRSKSYIATGLCYAIGSGAGQFLGHNLPTDAAAVYVDVERLSATELRLAVWLYVDGRDPANLHMVLTDGVRLNNPDTVRQLIEAVQAADLNRRVAVVIIDSLGAALPGMELNSSGPATSAGTQLRRIRDALGCAVGVVAHSPKSGDETVAGSLHFDAIFDTTLFVRSEDQGATGSLYVKKDNCMALEEHERFIHWKRESLGGPVGERTMRVHRLHGAAATAPAPRARLKPGSLQERAWHVLCDAWPDNRPITDAEFKAAVEERDAFAVKRGVIYDIKRRLESAGLIVIDDAGRFNRRME